MLKQRKRIRLRNFDYSSNGRYFITINVKNHRPLFGDILNQVMEFSVIGKIADAYLKEIPNHYQEVIINEYVIMPNHVHILLTIDKKIKFDSKLKNQCRINQFSQPIAGSVSVIIQQFKSSVKRWCNKNDCEYFQWQSKFHDHVIRNDWEYFRIKNYIQNNIGNWEKRTVLTCQDRTNSL